MKIKMYDSLSSKQIEFNKKKLNIYSCGPTVYDYIHIGNARALILVDVLYRYTNANYIQNITDIDDKIIYKAIESKKSETEVSSFYIDAYLKSLKDLNIKEPTKIVKISDEIETMINFIDELVKNGSAYISNGNVYFEINKFKDQYGKLSKRNIDELIAGERLELDTNKKDSLDFTLWKNTTQGITFDSPFGKGRPGWHTECVVLINKYFNGETIDIHLGGIDLKFPHHENERIQFIAKHNKELATAWVHNGHLNINHEKMSKSLNNSIFVKDFIQKYSANILRWICLGISYQKPLDITDDLISQAIKWEEKIFNFYKKAIQYNIETNNKLFISDIQNTEFNKLMDDDLNTSNVMPLIDNLIKSCNVKYNEQTANDVLAILDKLGFVLPAVNLNKDIINSYKTWKKLIEDKNFSEADELRLVLQEEGIL